MSDIKILDLFFQSSLLVKLIILILIFFSVISWAIIIQRTHIFNLAMRKTKVFEEKFLSGIELDKLYKTSHMYHDSLIGSERIFYAGFKEFSRLHCANNYALESIIEGVSRVMRLSMNRDLATLENYISFLGTIASISPYIGLFGTVCGILNAFIALGMVQQATLQMVAPGIAEALITTAISLVTAIPAVMAYNRFNQRINHIEQNYINFMDEFTAILHHKIFISIENK